MMLLIKSFLVIFIILINQSVSAQSIGNSEFYDSLRENPIILDGIKNKNSIGFKDKLPVSENQEIPNSNNLNNLSLKNTKKINSKSMLIKYFSSLTGEDLNMYGADEFNQRQDDKLLFFNTVGENYHLAPGDIIDIAIMGLNSSRDSFKVDRDGMIIIDDVYLIPVDGLSISEVQDIIYNKLSLDDASVDVYVKLNTARLVTVQISGNVKSPRTIAVPAYTPLSRVLAYSGGVSDNGSLRNISLSQSGEPTENVDFYNFLQNPSSTNDPLIIKGARIFVPNKGSTVAASGFSGNPGIYELSKSEEDITIESFLKLTGTSFVPPGAVLKVLYTDKQGKFASRIVSKQSLIQKGEALKIEFIATRELNTSVVSGAVIRDFQISSNEELSVRKILKDGAVLSPNIFSPFALIIGKKVQAINITEALKNENITLPVGASLKLYTKSDYEILVSEDPNNTKNTLLNKLNSANLGEIYLNGKRIAYVPTEINLDFLQSIYNFYTPNPKTVYDIALIANSDGVEAFSLQSAINKKDRPPLSAGDRLFIFENKFYEDLLKNDLIINESKEIKAAANAKTVNNEISMSADALRVQQEFENADNNYNEELSYSRRILQKANLTEIKLDGKLVTFLPFVEKMQSAEILKILRGRLPTIINDFLVVKNKETDATPEIKSLRKSFEIKKNQSLNFISQSAYQSILINYQSDIITDLLFDVRRSDAVQIYMDGKLIYLLPPNKFINELDQIQGITQQSNFYKLYTGLTYRNSKSKVWENKSIDFHQLFSNEITNYLNASTKINFFSVPFIRDKFINNNELKILPSVKNPEDLVDLSLTGKISNSYTLNTHLKIMEASKRNINGAVLFPGAYPVAENVILKDFIQTAQLKDDASQNFVRINKSVLKDGKITPITHDTVYFNSGLYDVKKLDGIYDLEIPIAFNDALSGQIRLSGEFLSPGVYSFSRADTLEDIIERAGGISEVAYPLGAVFQRESIKKQESDSNNILATQLEESILGLAQSDIVGVGDQISAVLGFADQLRNQRTLGRLSLNIMDEGRTSPFYLQDGDVLTVPKRPSNVTIVGAVKRNTIASYVNGHRFKDYIKTSGGFSKIADVKQSYLLLPNGESRPINNSSIIPVGSVIIIPPKLDRLSILGLTDIVSRVLGNIATSILAINNVN